MCFHLFLLAILYPSAEINFNLIKSLINLAYWPIYGEMKLREIALNENLSSEGIFYAYVSTIIYVCIANIFLLNMLIAMFK